MRVGLALEVSDIHFTAYVVPNFVGAFCQIYLHSLLTLLMLCW